MNDKRLANRLTTLRDLAGNVTSDEDAKIVIARIQQAVAQYNRANVSATQGMVELAHSLDPGFRIRPHTQYISDRIAAAVRDVENGINRKLVINLPPRSGKSTLISRFGPVWLLNKHPEWSIVMSSHDGSLAGSWATSSRELIEDHPELGVRIRKDGGAGSRWETTSGGSMFTVSVRGALTGRGAKVLIIDDPIANYADSHSVTMRKTLWDWWLSVAYTRLEPPYLVLLVMTRWHTDDLTGRMFSDEYEGDPNEWEKINIPALAESGDLLGRSPGEPLLSPMQEETPQEALKRTESTRRAVGSYTFASMYQQRPAPSKGSIFDVGWWRYWTSDPDKATEDGRVIHIDPTSMTSAKWLDSWDTAFKARDDGSGSWVVGQRWARDGANRFLVAQKRGRWGFTATLAQMDAWANPGSFCGNLVHQRIIEERANGAAIIDVLRSKISGLKPVNPTVSKEARARAVTPECESGNVYLPYPGDKGNEWVSELLSELRTFPHDANDDQVDALTQALAELRDPGMGMVTVPKASMQGSTGRSSPASPAGVSRWVVRRNIAAAARTQFERKRDTGY